MTVGIHLDWVTGPASHWDVVMTRDGVEFARLSLDEFLDALHVLDLGEFIGSAALRVGPARPSQPETSPPPLFPRQPPRRH